jgi:hypothetical protein
VFCLVLSYHVFSLILTFLKAVFGNSVQKLKLEHKTIKVLSFSLSGVGVSVTVTVRVGVRVKGLLSE